MTEYINKAEVVKELERIKKEQCPSDLYEGRCMLFLCEQILYFINTLEVKNVGETKDVDLDKEIKDYLDQQPIVATYNKTKYQLIPPAEKIARYFYKLGRINARKNK